MSLVEIMVTIGIAGILLLGTTQMIASLFEQQRAVIQLMNAQDLRLTVQSAIRGRDGCGNTFSGRAIPTVASSSTTITDIKNGTPPPPGTGTVVVSTGSTLGTGGSQLTVDKLELLSTGTNLNGSPKVAQLKLTYTAPGPNSTTVTKSMLFPLTVVPDASGKVNYCWANESDNSSLCSFYGANFNNTTGRCNQVNVEGDVNAANVNSTTAINAPKICLNGVCVTRTGDQQCPYGSYGTDYKNVVGITAEGALICGKAE